MRLLDRARRTEPPNASGSGRPGCGPIWLLAVIAGNIGRLFTSSSSRSSSSYSSPPPAARPDLFDWTGFLIVVGIAVGLVGLFFLVKRGARGLSRRLEVRRHRRWDEQRQRADPRSSPLYDRDLDAWPPRF